MSLEKRLNKALMFSGINQAELGRAVKATRSTVSAWCDGTTKTMKSSYVCLAAKRMGVSPCWLSDGIGDMVDPDIGISGATLDKVFMYMSQQLHKFNEEFYESNEDEKRAFLSKFYSVAVKKANKITPD